MNIFEFCIAGKQIASKHTLFAERMAPEHESKC